MGSEMCIRDSFNVLSAEEYGSLKDAISLITIYIAAADGEIEEDETRWAEKVTKIRSYNLPEDLRGFYKDVGEDFSDKLENLRTTLPKVEAERLILLEEKLAALNPILAKLDRKLGAEMYKSFVTFAKHVAKASGGFLGFFSVGPKEAELIKLSMLDEIVYEEEA